MTTYLDKEAVRKALSDIGMKACGLWNIIQMVDGGKFDTKPLLTDEAVQSCYRKTLADKDAEISGLKKHIEICIARDDANEARISELEKLCDMQKTTIDARGKALREARETYDKLRKSLKVNYGIYGIPSIQEYADQNPSQKEPELVICPTSADCSQDGCPHKKPHQKIAHPLGDHLSNCDRAGKCGGMTECIPLKAPVPQQKRLMDDSRGNTFEGQIDRLETALKALQEEVKGTSITGENGTIYSLKVKRTL
jgi:uncharacterized coiled-coil protein SlyX